MRLSLLALCVLVGCTTVAAAPPVTGHRAISTVSTSGRFTSAPACEPGEITLTRNPIRVASGGSVVVKITACNTTAGDRMAVYIANDRLHGACNATTDSQIGTNGDGGSASGGTNFAVIAGTAPCAGSYVEVSDLASGAVVDAPISVY